MNAYVWLIVHIEFTGLEPDGHLRHSKFVGLRDDKDPPLIAPSLHAVSEGLPLVASASKCGLALALIQVAVTILANLTFGGYRSSRTAAD